MMKLFLFILSLFFSMVTLHANVAGGGTTGTGANVTLTDNGTTVVLANGIVSITINKTSATITNFTYKGINLFSGGTNGGQFYWTWNQPNLQGPNGTYSIVANPSSNGGNYAEIMIHTPWSGDTATAAMDVAIHYSLSRGNQGYYAAATLTHPASYPTNPGGEWRSNAYVGSIFNWMSIDSLHNKRMPSIADVSAALAVTGAPKEVIQMTSGVDSGQYICKYSNSADLSAQNVYGWTSESKHVGIWMTFPSHEYYNGGPLKRELTCHQGNTFLNMLNGQHYGMGDHTDMVAGTYVEKTFGPYLIYANAYLGATTDPVATVASSLWADAKAQAIAEQAAWPYTWFTNSNYVQESGRGTVTGTLAVVDAANPNVSSAGAWIGLAPDDNGTDFQYQQNTYQFWVKTDAKGNFTIPHVIPGVYNLWAWGAGNLGTFEQKAITVTAAQTLNLGTVTWTPSRVAHTVWDIGIPDRDSKEFKNGDYNYCEWQNYIDIPTEYPNGVNYTVGTSDWTKDWNYGLLNATSWTVNFTLPEAPTAGTASSLYVALASNYGTHLIFYVNGTQVSSFAPGNVSDAVIRLGSHGAFYDTRIPITSSLLKKGTNTLLISQLKGTVEFDYLRLEATIPLIITAGGPTKFCEGGSVTLTASTGKSYKWLNGTNVLPSTSNTYTVTASGAYRVIEPNSSNSFDTSAVTTVLVNALPLPTISGLHTVVIGKSTVLTASTQTQYKWFNGTTLLGTAQSYTVTAAGVYTLSATDANACIGSTTYQVTALTQQSIPLVKGWNLISTNIVPSDSSIATLFNGLNVQEIKTAYAFWRLGQNTAFNSLTAIIAGQGYLVYMNTAAVLTVTGIPISVGVSYSSLPSGWNIIGCPYQTSNTISSLFTATNAKSIKDFTGFWIPNGTTNNISTLDPGKAYFYKK